MAAQPLPSNSTGFDRHHTSRHYSKRLTYTITALKNIAVVDTETRAVLDIHCTTRKHDTPDRRSVALRNVDDLLSLAADKGYDWMLLH